MDCITCAAHGMFHCRETVGTCDLCGTYGDVYMDYGKSGDRERPDETVCLDCLSAGKHLQSAHEPANVKVLAELLPGRGIGDALRDYSICPKNSDGIHGPIHANLDPDIASTHVSVICRTCGTTTGYSIEALTSELEWD